MIGSIALDDFREHSSDIDLLVIMEKTMSKTEYRKMEEYHRGLSDRSRLGNRIEVSYITEEMLNLDSGYGMNRPYYNSGRFRYEIYGHELAHIFIQLEFENEYDFMYKFVSKIIISY